MTDRVREPYPGYMTANHTFSSPAPRFLDPAGVNEFGYVDPVQRLRQQQGLQALQRIGQHQAYVASTPYYDTNPMVGYPSFSGVRPLPRHRSTLERESSAAVVALAVALIVIGVSKVVGKLLRVIRIRREARHAA